MKQIAASKQITVHVYFILIALFALVLRVVIATTYQNDFDLRPYNIPWAIAAAENPLNIYQNIQNLDYPPIFPMLLSLVGTFVKQAQMQQIWQLEMFWIKLIPVLSDILLMCIIYVLTVKHYQMEALFFAAFWAVNPSIIFNCAFWGQADVLLLLFIFLTFWCFWKQKPTVACVFFALGCLTKLQMAYFAPIVLCELFFHYHFKYWIKALGIGLMVGIAGWLPFMIASGSIFLPFDIYFGGFESYQFINLNAYNLYGIGENNWVPDSQKLFGITYAQISMIIMILLLVVFICVKYFYRQIPGAVHALFFINSIFMLTCRMHERYQLPALILALLCYLIQKDNRYLYLFLGICMITFFNQALLLFIMNFGGVFRNFFDNSQKYFSIVNLLFYGFHIWIYITEMKRSKRFRLKRTLFKKSSAIS